MVKDTEVVKKMEAHTGTSVDSGAVSGATTGRVVGGLAGLLVGIGAVLIGEPLVAALGLTGAAATAASGAMTGAVAGGIVGALVWLGLPEEVAKDYEREIQAGGILLVVPAGEGDTSREIMERAGSVNVDTYGAIA